jgi:beta-glucosidase
MKKKFKVLQYATLAIWCAILVSCSRIPDYKNRERTVDERVADLLSKMTLDEKIEQLAGLSDPTGMKTTYNERFAIPDFKMSDGPLGVRWQKATAFPSGVSLAATFDTSLARRYGKMLAIETKSKGRNLILGPCVNIHRLPTGGRNFESYGEDPFLAARLAVSYVKGVQGENVIPSVKHFALNNQEWGRTEINVTADERTMHEIYLPAFEAAVKEGGAYTIMASYNKLNGWYASENKQLLKEILKDEWKFKGLVMSDWGATHSTANAIKNGLDLEMPTGEYLNKDAIKKAIKNGEITESDIDEMVKRSLWVKFSAGLFDITPNPDSTLVSGPESRKLAYEVAVRSVVLLKNEKSILPLNLKSLKSIAVIGPNAGIARTGGGGSSHIEPAFNETPLDVIRTYAGNDVVINYAEGVHLTANTIHPIESSFLKTPDGIQGLKAEYFNGKDLQGAAVISRTEKNIDFTGDDESPVPGIGKDNYSVRWTGKLTAPESRKFCFYTCSDDGVRFYLNNKLLILNWSDHGSTIDSAVIELKKGQEYTLSLEFYENGGSAVCQLGWDYSSLKNASSDLLQSAVNAAKNSEIAIVFVGSSDFIESEGYDRVGGLKLSGGQDALVEAVVNANPRTIVVLNSGTVILTGSWGNKVQGLLETFFPGQEGSTAIADILFGKANPSGKLPFSFIASASQSPAYNGYKDTSLKAPYAEGIYVGYRYLEKNQLKPAFPFGFGLSYTTFDFTSMQTQRVGQDSCIITVSVQNTGSVAGFETVQIYVAPPSGYDRPVRELKGFAPVYIKPGETETVRISLNTRSFSRYDMVSRAWVTDKGSYSIEAGSSSADIRLSNEFILK